jgi:hypothetical protein
MTAQLNSFQKKNTRLIGLAKADRTRKNLWNEHAAPSVSKYSAVTSDSILFLFRTWTQAQP